MLNPMRNDAGFPAAGPGKNKQGSADMIYSFRLVGIKPGTGHKYQVT